MFVLVAKLLFLKVIINLNQVQGGLRLIEKLKVMLTMMLIIKLAMPEQKNIVAHAVVI